MAGTHITIEVDDAALKRELADLIKRLEHPGDALSEIGEILTESTKQRFADQGGPGGEPWAPNTDVTRARKENPNILTEGGYLGDLIRYQVTDGGRTLEVGSDQVYAAVQQFGQPKGASGRTKRGSPIPWGDIPARPFLGVSDSDRARILDVLRDYLSDR